MPPRSKVLALPSAVKAWLDAALVEGNFSGYELLAGELAKRGCAVSKSSLQRYGSDFEGQIKTLKLVAEQARAVVEASPDDADDMSQALIRLTQQKTFELLRDAEIDPAKVNFEKLTLNVSRLARASVPIKKMRAEIEAEARKRLQSEQEQNLQEAARAQGLDEAQVEFWRKKVLGIG